MTPDVLLPAAFAVETCLRRIWITMSTPPTANHRVASAIGAEQYTGVDAYEFLLRMACGLESEIAGESDVFGQVKESWQLFRTQHADAALALDPLMHRLFEDVKEIRTRHLAGLGAAKYGSLVRTILGANVEAPTLVIGAGQMARAVLPYLPGRPLMIANRTASRARQMLNELGACLPNAAGIDVIADHGDAEIAAWHRASNVILCVPPDQERDALRVPAWMSRRASGGRLLHLGILSAAGSAWDSIPSLATLSDLFALRATHRDRRQLRFAGASRECRERARLRDLGGPINLAHGWEDLSLFANIA